MTSVTEFLKANAKAVAGFVVGIVLTAVQDVVEGRSPVPTSINDWAKYLGTALVSGVVVWATGNKLTQKQIVKGAVQQGVSVITTQAVNEVKGRVNDAVQDAVQNIPGVIPAPSIIQAAQRVSNEAERIVKDIAKNFDFDVRNTL